MVAVGFDMFGFQLVEVRQISNRSFHPCSIFSGAEYQPSQRAQKGSLTYLGNCSNDGKLFGRRTADFARRIKSAPPEVTWI